MQGAEFQYPHMPIMEMKAACVGFRKDLWYHLNFSARRRDDHDEEQSFFAELRYDQCSDDLIVQICTILHMCMHGWFYAYPDSLMLKPK